MATLCPSCPVGRPPSGYRDWGGKAKPQRGGRWSPTEHRDWVGAEQDLKGEGEGHPQNLEIGGQSKTLTVAGALMVMGTLMPLRRLKR